MPIHCFKDRRIYSQQSIRISFWNFMKKQRFTVDSSALKVFFHREVNINYTTNKMPIPNSSLVNIVYITIESNSIRFLFHRNFNPLLVPILIVVFMRRCFDGAWKRNTIAVQPLRFYRSNFSSCLMAKPKLLLAPHSDDNIELRFITNFPQQRSYCSNKLEYQISGELLY